MFVYAERHGLGVDHPERYLAISATWLAAVWPES